MASNILPFDTGRFSASISSQSRRSQSVSAGAQTARATAQGSSTGPRLAYSRQASGAHTSQASRASRHIQQELTGLVQDGIFDRHAACQAERQASLLRTRKGPASVPAQATSVGLRQRLFDALFLFAHSA